jgi:hypothetical protein
VGSLWYRLELREMASACACRNSDGGEAAGNIGGYAAAHGGVSAKALRTTKKLFISCCKYAGTGGTDTIR